MSKFDKMIKRKYNFCYLCKDYYTGLFCDDCQEKACDLYNKSIMTKYILSRIIPYHIYAKIFLIASQMQNQYKLIHIEKYILKLIDLLKDEKTLLTIFSIVITFI